MRSVPCLLRQEIQGLSCSSVWGPDKNTHQNPTVQPPWSQTYKLQTLRNLWSFLLVSFLLFCLKSLFFKHFKLSKIVIKEEVNSSSVSNSCHKLKSKLKLKKTVPTANINILTWATSKAKTREQLPEAQIDVNKHWAFLKALPSVLLVQVPMSLSQVAEVPWVFGSLRSRINCNSLSVTEKLLSVSRKPKPESTGLFVRICYSDRSICSSS